MLHTCDSPPCLETSRTSAMQSHTLCSSSLWDFVVECLIDVIDWSKQYYSFVVKQNLQR